RRHAGTAASPRNSFGPKRLSRAASSLSERPFSASVSSAAITCETSTRYAFSTTAWNSSAGVSGTAFMGGFGSSRRDTHDVRQERAHTVSVACRQPPDQRHLESRLPPASARDDHASGADGEQGE